MGQTERTGEVVFNDASLGIWEEGLRGTWEHRENWEKSFKKQVFSRIVQQLNRLGWKCIIPPEMIEQYSRSFAINHRYCVKGDLKADLSLSGRHIEFNMFQNINAPDRPDHEGRYQGNKEQVMPYVMKLEMNRTRNKIKDYLCNVFTDYKLRTDRFDGRMNKRGPDHLTAMEWIEGCYESSSHFKGDLSKYDISDYNRNSADGLIVNHGQRVWFADYKGRICTGIAYYNINNMWWVMTGKYDVNNKASFDLYTSQPENIRKKRNGKLREKALKGLMNKAVEIMDFERAAILRDLLKKV